MKRGKYYWISLILTAVLVMIAISVFAQERPLLITTESGVPLSMSSDGGKTIYGASADKVHEMLRRAHIPYQMELTSWNRAIELARADANTCVFSAARTADREPKFKWIGPLARGTWVIVGKSDKLGKITQLAQIKSADIGVYTGDAVGEYLSQQNYHTVTSYHDEATIKNLMIDRIDYWATDANAAIVFIHANKLDDKLSVLFKFADSAYYLACNPKINQDQFDRMTAQFNAMKADGTNAKIDELYPQ